MINYTCYSDGAFSSTRNQGGIGVVFLRNGVKVFEYSKGFKDTTNNQMEIVAALTILKAIKIPIDTLTIYTDSMYVIGCATKGWQRKKNVKLWNKFDIEFNRVKQLCSKIEFVHVKGHNGDYWNQYVDELAVTASKELL